LMQDYAEELIEIREAQDDAICALEDAEEM
jgi:hypothetical protein